MTTLISFIYNIWVSQVAPSLKYESLTQGTKIYFIAAMWHFSFSTNQIL